MKENNIFKEISDSVFKFPIFDTHEHIIPEDIRRSKDLDVFFLFSHYVGTDLIASGMPKDKYNSLYNNDIDIEDRWNILYPYINNIRNTSYYNILLESVRDIFGVEDINENTYKSISEQLKQTKNINWYDKIIAEKCNIKFIANYVIKGMQDVEEESILNRKETIAVKNFDDIVSLNSLKEIHALEKDFNCNIYRLEDLLNLIDKDLEESVKKGYKVLKIISAYFRDIKFKEASFAEAEKSFLKIFNLKDYGLVEGKEAIPKDDLKPFQDYLIHYLIQKAIKLGWPVQIHTGLLNSNINDLSNTNPCYLINLFLKYRNCKFDIFHTGYPFTNELISISKEFPNVYFDLCWIHQVSCKLYKEILSIALETIPLNKIFGFGGDNFIVECTYGSQKVARRLITEVLSEKVKENYFTVDQAVEAAERILYLNPKEFFNV